MVDLHLHLDGSLSPSFVIAQAKAQGIVLPVPESHVAELMSPKNCRDLNDYLKAFELPLTVLQVASGLTDAYCALARRLKETEVDYAEIRFAPQLHTKKGLSSQDIVEAVLRGREQAQASDVRTNVILCCMRGKENIKQNFETVELARAYAHKGIVGVDLAGAEALYDTAGFKEIFCRAVSYGIPITIHAGEADGADSVRKALAMGARRIGHGVRMAEDKKLLELVSREGIGVEMCPTSNIQTKAIADFADYPILRYLELGILATVNTDNMTVSDTTVGQEFRLLKSKLGMTDAQRATLIDNSYKIAFGN